LIAHADMNGDGKVGWGRYWKLSGPSGDARGGDTTFAMGCALPRNKAYDDELYDDARITQFLIELYRTTKDPRYLATAKAAIDATWGQGESEAGGRGFAYYKTIGPCDRGWLVKNVNMLMAVPIASLATITGEGKYRERAEKMLWLEHAELDRTVGGRTAPNLGYYDTETMARHPTRELMSKERKRQTAASRSCATWRPDREKAASSTSALRRAALLWPSVISAGIPAPIGAMW
jgi:hypothetical protein